VNSTRDWQYELRPSASGGLKRGRCKFVEVEEEVGEVARKVRSYRCGLQCGGWTKTEG
jgi:hypothetical protein